MRIWFKTKVTFSAKKKTDIHRCVCNLLEMSILHMRIKLKKSGKGKLTRVAGDWLAAKRSYFNKYSVFDLLLT